MRGCELAYPNVKLIYKLVYTVARNFPNADNFSKK